MCNFKRIISFILVVALMLPATVFAEGTAVAENVQTGTVYADLQTALENAEKGHTVKLLADIRSERVIVGVGQTLDLNGFTLTANLFSAPFTNTHVIDSQDSSGLLILTGSYAFNRKNEQLPIWTSEGVRFAKVAIKEKLQPIDENTARYKFYLNMRSGDTIVDDILANGSSGTGITIRIRVRSMSKSGLGAEESFVLNDELVKGYVAAWDASMVILTVIGVANKVSVEYYAEVVSTAPNGTAVVIGV